MIEILPEVWVDPALVEGFRYYRPVTGYDALREEPTGPERFAVRFYVRGDMPDPSHSFPTRSERDLWMTFIHIALETDNAPAD